MTTTESPLLLPYFRKSAELLLTEYSRSCEQNASDNLGHNREVFCSKFLSGVLPNHLRISSGEIWDSERAKTGQLDLIVVRDDAIPLDFSGNRRTYLAEGVFAVIEVKSNLTRTKLVEAGESLERVSHLKVLPCTGIKMGKDATLNRPLRIAFGYKGATFDTLAEEICSRSWHNLFDLVCILDQGALVAKDRLLTHPRNHEFLRFNAKAAALGFLWYYLVTYGASFRIRTWDNSPYLEPLPE
ncbi:MAG: hypothetical protein MRJ96_03090 [Nitrospirales bacterium]|nr:hypothetical protein [Nitrospira sp.]MDR4500423.1 hypothetical protein [Nitrospirales bacterium]